MKISTLTAFSLLAAGFAVAEPVKTGDADIGPVLQTLEGMTLYTYKNDPEGRSVCNGSCASKWPPLLANAEASATAPYSVIKRDDDTLQWAYQGKPLYTWVMDMEPGHTTGHGVGGVWEAARPEETAE